MFFCVWLCYINRRGSKNYDKGIFSKTSHLIALHLNVILFELGRSGNDFHCSFSFHSQPPKQEIQSVRRSFFICFLSYRFKETQRNIYCRWTWTLWLWNIPQTTRCCHFASLCSCLHLDFWCGCSHLVSPWLFCISAVNFFIFVVVLCLFVVIHMSK